MSSKIFTTDLQTSSDIMQDVVSKNHYESLMKTTKISKFEWEIYKKEEKKGMIKKNLFIV